ncbi:MAG: ribulose-phosphate 3-epimerase [Bacteriovoracaceae bacterium]|jgi:ribulose-phosphate 3-epimerase|nr:ribulose-phosphate 3-epimerase [Bacteriovoracaceae bacterium]
MTIISPSLLACDFVNIEAELNHFTEVKDIWFHLDIMDGHFVPNLTFGQTIIKLIAKKTNQLLDAHFMVSNPDFYIEELKDYGLHNFTFHVEACDNPLELLLRAKKYYPSVGISLKPGTELSVLSDDILKEIDLLLVMSVEPGFGGQSFIENTYNKLNDITDAKEKHGYNFNVQVDGGVSNANSHKLIKHGCNNLVAGSYVFKDGPTTYLSKIDSLRN